MKYSSVTIYYGIKGGSKFLVCGWNPLVWPVKQYFSVVLFIMLHKVVQTLEFVDAILKCDHSIESYWAVRSFGTVLYAVRDGSNLLVCVWTKS